jgi:tRNA threonylcarbamoyladenosine biosynthesis protein TsaB
MKILAVDTALGGCSAALLNGETVLAHRCVAMERGHAEALAPMVEDIMREAGVAFAALERLAVTTGPGTFTGQRVGLAFMRGLRVALKIPLAGITTLEAMAAAAMEEAGTSAVAVLHDAKRDEVYFSLVESGGISVAPLLATFNYAIAMLPRRTAQPLAFAGTAAARAASLWREQGGIASVTSIVFPDALWVARLGLAADEPAGAPKPLYLRAPDAKLPAAI